MTTTYSIELPYPPLSGNRASRVGQGRHYTPKELVSYYQRVAIATNEQGVHGMRLEGPLSVGYVVAPPDLRSRDSDNVLKVVKDSLTRAGFWVDDSNQVIRREWFEWGGVEDGGRVAVTVWVR